MTARRSVASWMTAGTGVCLGALAPMLAPAAEPAAKIRYYEPFTVVADAVTRGAQKSAANSVSNVHFSAYGRRFDLALEKNSRLEALAVADASGPTQTLYRGVIENVPGSWVRLSAKGQTIRGMIWDGQDLYIAELADAVRASLDPALPAPAANTVIFKLADAVIDKAADFCASDAAAVPASARDAYQSLIGELKGSPIIQQAAGAGERLELSIYGDSKFLALSSSEQQARDEILLRMNNVDGIFTSQLGIELQVPTMVLATPQTDAFSNTTVPSTLLNELRQYRRQTPAMYSRGLTHMFTGRDMDGNTVGIAYQDVLCNREYGVGLTEASGRTSWIESLIAAHEIGHNFGAGHDGEDQCASTPSGQFLMSPSVNPNASTFSACSVATMRPLAQSASCIVALPPADLYVPADLGISTHSPSTQFSWDLVVTNIGGSVAVNSKTDVVVPPSMVVDEAWVEGGSCTSGAGTVSCLLGDVPGSSTRVVHLALHSDVVGSNSISATTSSQSDAQSANNTGNGTLVIDAAGATTPSAPSSPPPSQNANAGGGGGSTDVLWLATLVGLLVLRRKVAVLAARA